MCEKERLEKEAIAGLIVQEQESPGISPWPTLNPGQVDGVQAHERVSKSELSQLSEKPREWFSFIPCR